MNWPHRSCEPPTPSRNVRTIRHAAWALLAVTYGLLPVVAETPSTPEAEPPQVGPPKTAAPTATIAGRVTVVDNKRMPPMIVYLEPTDATQRFPRPTEPIEVSQKNAKFSPDFLIVPVGQTVVFPNDEDRPIEHNVFSRSRAKRFDLGLYRPNEQQSVTFDKPGVVRLYCSIHRYMNGVVFVSPTPYFAHVDKDGRYTIANVRPGAYVVRTWQRTRRYREQHQPVELVAGGSATIDWELKRK